MEVSYFTPMLIYRLVSAVKLMMMAHVKGCFASLTLSLPVLSLLIGPLMLRLLVLAHYLTSSPPVLVRLMMIAMI